MNKNGWIISLIVLTASGFLMELSFTMVTPFLPLYLVQDLKVAPDDVNLWSGAVFSVTFFISGLLGPVWGVIADRKSRKLMALRASVCLAISYTLCGLVSTVEGLFAARVFQGLSAGLYPALLALVATTMPNNKIGLSMGLLQGGMTIGGIGGPFIGGVLSTQFGMRNSFYIAGVALAIITVLIFFYCKEGKHEPIKEKKPFFDFSVLKSPAIMQMLIGSAVIYAALFSLQPIFPLYIAELQGSMDNITLVAGTVFSISGISVMIASPLLGAAGQKFGFMKVLLICLVLSAAVIALQVVPDSVEGLTFWRFLGGFAVAGLIPTVNAILSQVCPPEEKGQIYGFNFLTGHVGMALGPLIAAWAAGVCGYAFVIAASGLILLPYAAWLILCNRKAIN